MSRLSLEDRFSKFVSPDEKGCLLWTRAKDDLGYGMIRWDGKVVRSHRLAWLLAYGEIPDGLCVLHKCDVPACVNPSHLFLGTKGENNADRDRKGRTYRRTALFCKQGHELSGHNLAPSGNGNPMRCRICHNESAAAHRERKKKERVRLFA